MKFLASIFCFTMSCDNSYCFHPYGRSRTPSYYLIVDFVVCATQISGTGYFKWIDATVIVLINRRHVSAIKH